MKKAKVLSRSGRFASGPEPELIQFSQSVSCDWRLWEQDILGSMAHAAMLCKIGILTRRELKEITRALEAIGKAIARGEFAWDPALEDVHMNIEAALTKRVKAGEKLHTGRSRNDQVVLDLRLWLREELGPLDAEINGLQRTLLDQARASAEIYIPGYTHLQRAQPVPFAHHWLAYIEMLERDRERFADGYRRVNVCPLGSAALAGSTLPLNREMVAELLGFTRGDGTVALTENSMDAVSDRDFVVEFCGSAALLSVHLSRLAEDLILWSSAEFGFVRIDDAFTTGSSLMPQKKNPDIAELTRGRTGRVVGNLVALLTMLKGLPLTYNRDLQEDKERLFDTVDTVRSCLRLMAGMLRQTRINSSACAAAVADPLLLATDLVDHLVLQGIAFRSAHHLVGQLVRRAEELGKPIPALSPAELRAVSPAFGPGVLKIFDLRRALSRRELRGGPGPAQVQSRLAYWDDQLQSERPPQKVRREQH